MADTITAEISKTVGNPSARYEKFCEKWDKMRDAMAGQDAIRGEETEYLRKLEGQDSIDGAYEKYLEGALWYNASGRTRQAYMGLIFRKDPDITLPDSMGAFEEDCTLSGIDLDTFIREMVEEEMTVSRFAVLVDYPDTEGTDLSQAEAEAQGFRPYLVKYEAGDILGVKKGKVGNATVITQVRLRENRKEEGEDEFDEEDIEQVRVLDLITLVDDQGNQHTAYRQRVFRQIKDSQFKGDTDQSETDWVEIVEMRRFPKMKGQFITEIPLFFVGGPDFRTPWMEDLVDVNIHHYQTYADYSAGVKWTTRPQPWKSGPAGEEEDTFYLGAGELWQFPEGTQVGMLEYTGRGLSAVEKKLDDLKGDMAILGARMLVPEKKKAETAEAHAIKREGENSALSTVADLVSDCITKACQFAAQWMNIADMTKILIQLNKDYLPAEMSVDDMVKLFALKQSGGITDQDYAWNLKQGERIDPSLSDDDRAAQLETEPSAGFGNGDGGNE